jgi:hypothetical protein
MGLSFHERPGAGRTLADFRAYVSAYLAELGQTGYTGRVDISLRRFPLSTKQRPEPHQ